MRSCSSSVGTACTRLLLTDILCSKEQETGITRNEKIKNEKMWAAKYCCVNTAHDWYNLLFTSLLKILYSAALGVLSKACNFRISNTLWAWLWRVNCTQSSQSVPYTASTLTPVGISRCQSTERCLKCKLGKLEHKPDKKINCFAPSQTIFLLHDANTVCFIPYALKAVSSIFNLQDMLQIGKVLGF